MVWFFVLFCFICSCGWQSEYATCSCTHTQQCSACLLCWHREHLMFVLLLKWRAAGCLLPHSRRICHSLLNGSNRITAAWKGKRMLFSPLIFAQNSIKPLKQWHRRKRPTLDSTKTENSIFSFPDLCFLYFVTMVCFYYYVQWRMLLLLKLMQRDMIHIHLQSFRAACDAGSMVAVWWASLI